MIKSKIEMALNKRNGFYIFSHFNNNYAGNHITTFNKHSLNKGNPDQVVWLTYTSKTTSSRKHDVHLKCSQPYNGVSGNDSVNDKAMKISQMQEKQAIHLFVGMDYRKNDIIDS